MQAAQSNNASDVFESNAAGPHLSKRLGASLESPVERPRHLAHSLGGAVRKFLEGQRPISPVPGLLDRLPGDSSAKAGLKPQEEQAAREDLARAQEMRDQDRRLERSLYEGRSAEAALSFGVLENFRDAERGYLGEQRYSADLAYLADGDGTESLFPYAEIFESLGQLGDGPGAPTPENVRDAIQRLAGTSSGSSGVVKSRLDMSLTTNRLAQIRAVEDTAQSPVFADVARRVWGDYGDEQLIAREAATVAGPDNLEQDLLRPVMEVKRGKAEEQTEVKVEPVSSASTFCAVVGPSDLQVSGVPETDLQSILTPAVEPVFIPEGCAFEDAALAHDACNLLAALGLYADLLDFPGVLAKEHTHYAAELKLVADRSHALISRMLKRVDAGARSAAVAGVSMDTSGQELGNCEMSAPDPAIAHAAATSVSISTEPVSTDLVDLLMRWQSLLSTLAEGTLDIFLGSRAARPIPIGAESMERILVNLVRNARAATVAGGAIRIGVGVRERDAELSSAEVVTLTVDDSGCGMTADQVNRILSDPGQATFGLAERPATESKSDVLKRDLPSFGEPQEIVSSGYGRWPVDRASSATVLIEAADAGCEAGALEARDEGEREDIDGNGLKQHGLGLQVVKDLVRLSGGRFAVQSSLGRGTRIEICWPVAAAVQVAAAVPLPVQNSHPQEESTWNAPLEIMHASPGEVTFDQAAPVQRASMEPSSRGPRPTAHAEDRSSIAIGPDGYSEADLRRMMLRMHRSSSMVDERTKEKMAGQKSVLTILSERPSDIYRTALFERSRTPAQKRTEATRVEAPELGTDNYPAVNGAIAC